ncbi:MAG: TRAP transporter substrate-binding protein [Xanthobacteraceae bacterium]
MQATTRRLAITGMAAGALLAAVPAQAQQFTMKLSQPTINDVTYEYFKRMKAGIEQRSAGKIKVDIYPSNQLGQLPAVVEGVALGTIEAAASANGFWISLEPRFQVLDAPGLFDSVSHGFKMLKDPDIRARLATWGSDKGVEILAPSLYSTLMLLSHKGIRTVADFQGQKIRTQGGAPIQVEPLKKVGVIPVSLPLGEALPAMQNRTIDGMVGAAAPYVAFKYYDIAKPMTYLPATLFAAPVVVNRRWLKSLGPELEAIVREESRKAEEVFGDWNINDIQSKEDIWKKNGGEVITMSPDESKRYIDAVSPVAASILSANPKVKEDYEALLAAAKRYR